MLLHLKYIGFESAVTKRLLAPQGRCVEAAGTWGCMNLHGSGVVPLPACLPHGVTAGVQDEFHMTAFGAGT